VGRTTFDLSAVQRALGMKVGVGLPSMQTEQMGPVVLLADFSKSFASEAFEARGVYALPGRAHEIQSIAPGGIVVERVRITGVANNVVTAGIFTTKQIVSVANLPRIDVGGSPTTSRVFNEPTSAPGAPFNTQLDLSAAGEYEVAVSWFVTSGSFLAFDITLSTGTLELQWREIPVHVGSE